MKKKAIIPILSLLLIVTVACSSADYAAAFHIEYEGDKRALPLSTLSTENISSKTQSVAQATAYLSWRVCTGVENGTLRVRNAPGVSAKVIYTLSENQEIHLPCEIPEMQKTEDGAMWIKITDAEGWVNARYICKNQIRH
ncbi:MAG: SH3 domain-containing protein [Anaerolineae bacterium]|jgi:hypothetical protein|nr:SH3 domain-containing protein [Anaerolineae bacterium]